MINSDTNKKAWLIRRKSAKNLGCKIMEVSWKHCLKLAKKVNISVINDAIKLHTKFNNIGEIIIYTRTNNLNPVFKASKYPILKIVANYFNMIMILADSKLIAKTA